MWAGLFSHSCVGCSFTVLEKKLRLWLFVLTIRLSHLTCSVTCVSCLSAGLLFAQPLFVVPVGVLVSDVPYSKCTLQGCGLAVERAVLPWLPVSL